MGEFDPWVGEFEQLVGALPEELRGLVESLGERSRRAQIREVIQSLCRWRPLSADQRSTILGRGKDYLVERLLGPMIREGTLITSSRA
ncbi:MAG: hypothetical protein HQL82_04370 [Magnetococcales bacterium]|nr:hypothetical protein [Magnetococcales bacterium]